MYLIIMIMPNKKRPYVKIMSLQKTSRHELNNSFNSDNTGYFHLL